MKPRAPMAEDEVTISVPLVEHRTRADFDADDGTARTEVRPRGADTTTQ